MMNVVHGRHVRDMQISHLLISHYAGGEPQTPVNLKCPLFGGLIHKTVVTFQVLDAGMCAYVLETEIILT